MDKIKDTRGLQLSARLRRAVLLCAIASMLTACSTDNVLDVRPSVDVGATAGIQPIPKESFRETRQGSFEPDEPETGNETWQDPPEPDYGSESAGAGLNGGDPTEQAGDYLRNSSAQDEPEQEPETAIVPMSREETYLAGFPRVTPRVEPSISSAEADCRRQLKRAGVRFEDIAPIRKSNSCYIDNPVKVSAIGNVQMKPAATLTCRMALTFAKWTNKELVPSARWKYLTGIKSIRQGSSYSCRSIAGSRTPSAHSTGNALDVMAIELNNGKTIDVRKQGFFAFRAKKLLNNVRADGCEYFSTVLGPGYNYDHRDHFHFDLMDRKNGRKACH